MDFSRLNNMEGITGVKPSVSPAIDKTKGLDKTGPGFADALKEIQNRGIASPQSVGGTQNANPLTFSKHAVERMQTRGIGMTPDRMQKLEGALSKAAAKGSKNTLVLMDDSAFIMSVKNKTVVTAMDRMNMKENLFTNIDSTIMV